LDIRTVDGELLWPERFGEKEVTELERRLGPTAASGQLQQSPTPRGGSIIQTDDWQRWPGKNVPELDYVVASLDTGMTDKEDSDYSALTVWGCFQAAGRVVGGELEGYDFMSSNEPSDRPNLFGIESRERMDVVSASLPKVLLLYAWAEKLPLPQLVEKVISSCFRFKVDTLVIENKAHGHAVNQVIKEMLAQKPFSVVMFDPRRYGDKSARLYAVQHLFSEEMIYAPGDWVDDYWSWKSWTDPVIQQFAQFPRGAHDDYVDSGSQALHHLRSRGFAPRKEQVVTGAVRSAMHKSRSKPLYNA
jgi:predicted phage terminase large subunit-like protein